MLTVILSFLLVEVVQAFGFKLTVDERASETGQELLGCRVVVGFTVLGLMVLVRFNGLRTRRGGSTGLSVYRTRSVIVKQLM